MRTTPTDLTAPGGTLVKGGVGYQYCAQRHQLAVSGRLRRYLLGNLHGLPPDGAGDRGAYGYYTVTNRGIFGKAGADIDLFLSAGPVADRATPHLERRHPCGKREGSFVQNGTQTIRVRFSVSARGSLRASAFSYDVSGHGRAKLYASWGRYFDWTKYSTGAQPVRR